MPPNPSRFRLTLLACLGLFLQAAIAGASDVPANARSVLPLAPGAKVPSVRVTTILGDTVDLADEVRDEGALLVFYRGGW